MDESRMLADLCKSVLTTADKEIEHRQLMYLPRSCSSRRLSVSSASWPQFLFDTFLVTVSHVGTGGSGRRRCEAVEDD